MVELIVGPLILSARAWDLDVQSAADLFLEVLGSGCDTTSASYHMSHTLIALYG